MHCIIELDEAYDNAEQLRAKCPGIADWLDGKGWRIDDVEMDVLPGIGEEFVLNTRTPTLDGNEVIFVNVKERSYVLDDEVDPENPTSRFRVILWVNFDLTKMNLKPWRQWEMENKKNKKESNKEGD